MSGFLKLNLADLGKGLLIAVLTSVFTVVYNFVQAGSLTFDWEAIVTAALTGALAYLSKNLFTNSDNELAKPESK